MGDVFGGDDESPDDNADNGNPDENSDNVDNGDSDKNSDNGDSGDADTKGTKNRSILPSTGDGLPVEGFAAALVASLVTIIGALVYRRRNRG